MVSSPFPPVVLSFRISGFLRIVNGSRVRRVNHLGHISPITLLTIRRNMATALRTSRVVYQLPNKGSWFENLAVRSDGTILATRLDVPEVWIIDVDAQTGSAMVKLPAPATSV